VSPLLANVYLHYALDLWFEKVVKPRCGGEGGEDQGGEVQPGTSSGQEQL